MLNSTKGIGANGDDEDTKATALLSMDERMEELIARFQWEVKASEVLTYGEGDDDDDDDSYLNDDGTSFARDKGKNGRGPPVIDGFYSTTPDDPYEEYHEDMFLEFVAPSTAQANSTSGRHIRGFGKYDNGNFRIVGWVSYTGAAYWTEECYDGGPPVVILARGNFRRLETGIVQFDGAWYRKKSSGGGMLGRRYQLFSHKALYTTTEAMVHSVAESSTIDLGDQWMDEMTMVSGAASALAEDDIEAVHVIPSTSISFEDPDNITPLGTSPSNSC